MLELPVAIFLCLCYPVTTNDRIDFMIQELEELKAIEREKRLYNNPYNPRFTEHEPEMD